MSKEELIEEYYEVALKNMKRDVDHAAFEVDKRFSNQKLALRNTPKGLEIVKELSL